MALFEKSLDPSGHFKRLNCDMETVRIAAGPIPSCINFQNPSFREQLNKHCETKLNSYWQFDFVTQSINYNGKTLFPYASVISEKEVLYVYDKNLVAIVSAFKQPDKKEVYSVHFPKT